MGWRKKVRLQQLIWCKSQKFRIAFVKVFLFFRGENQLYLWHLCELLQLTFLRTILIIYGAILLKHMRVLSFIWPWDGCFQNCPNLFRWILTEFVKKEPSRLSWECPYSVCYPFWYCFLHWLAKKVENSFRKLMAIKF